AINGKIPNVVFFIISLTFHIGFREIYLRHPRGAGGEVCYWGAVEGVGEERRFLNGKPVSNRPIRRSALQDAGVDCARGPRPRFNLWFLPVGLLSLHAHLRVSLRKVRERQRDFGPFQRLERHSMPEMRLNEAREEIFDLRFGQCGGRRRFRAETRWRWMRAGVWVSLKRVVK